VSTAINSAKPADPGLDALVMLLHFQGVAASRGQISHRLGTARIGAPEMLRCAKDLGLKARVYRTDWARLAKTPLPAIATLRDGGFMLVSLRLGAAMTRNWKQGRSQRLRVKK
jgi:ATP-binding cassette, subfamily B, bacterial HlyB/CyaB